ncbi:MAG: hypothetical protein XD60_0940 [Acetothermia bacterium 64_32]|nr:MAG: hypothetical protein XD60_0940 [Acetothermia bacterium 64_32]
MKKAAFLLVFACSLGLAGLAQETEDGLGGSLGVEFTVTPIAPASLDVDTAITASLSFAGASVESRTVISLAGLESEHLRLALDLDGVTLATGMQFDPCFSRYWFEVRGGCCPVELGALFLVENLAPACQTPSFTVGMALDFGLTFDPLFIRSITGFGVEDLYHLIDEYPETELTAVSGWWFSEELISVGFATQCLHAESIFVLNELGFSWAQLNASYTWPDAGIQLGTRVWIDSSFAFSQGDLILKVTIDPVELRSVTSMNFSGFLGQRIDISITFSGIKLYSRTSFTFAGLISEVLGFELSF